SGIERGEARSCRALDRCRWRRPVRRSSVERDGLTKLLRAHRREPVLRIHLARGCEKEFGKCPRSPRTQWIRGLSHCNGRRVSLRPGNGDHPQGLRVGGRVVLRQVMENDADISMAACDRMWHIAMLDPQTTRKAHRLPREHVARTWP